MKIRLLGTGAAEGIPAFYSDTRVSEYARRHGGKDIRTRSAALVDGRIKIDFGPDTLAQIQRYGLDARDWDALLFTHSHDDHFSVTELQYFLYPFSQLQEMPLPIYANASICGKIEEQYPDWPFDLQVTRSFEPVQIGNYTLTPIRAHHMDDEDAHNLILQRDGKTILYATDTGVWFEPTWEYLGSQKIDLLVIECTSGVIHSDYEGHLAEDTFFEVLDRMHKIGSLNGTSKVVTTHHSHNGDATHAELCAQLEPHGIVVGFDGFEIEA
jgi:phosphoribosyl 1,2-cyclic phosphate phosphodiesterase